jgi:hypothetical protein
VLLYLLLTGKPPFTGTQEQLMYKVVHEAPVLPSQLSDVLRPRYYDQIIATALAKDPNQRYPTAAAFKKAIEAGVGAPFDTTIWERTLPPSRPPRPAPRQRRGIGAAGHRQVGLAAALAAHLLGDEVDQLAGLDLAHAVGGDAGGQLHLAAVHRGQHDGRGLELVLQLVQRVAQRLGVGAVQRRGQHLQALHVDRLASRSSPCARGQLALQRGDLLLQRAHLLEHLRDAAGTSAGVTFSAPATRPTVPSSCCR